MKYKKVIIDGKEYLEIINDEEVNEAAAEHMDTEAQEEVDAHIDGGEECESGFEKFRRDAEDFFEKVGEGAKSIGTKIGKGAKSFGERVAKDVSEAGKKIKEGAERLFNGDKTLDPASTEAKLIKLLPYMSQEEIKSAAEKILANDTAVRGVKLSLVMPYLDKADCGAMFKRCIELKRDDLELAEIMQYVDRETVSEIVDGFIAGEYPELPIDSLYPFMSDIDIKKIFDHYVATEEE